MEDSATQPAVRYLQPVLDLTVTLLLWCYHIVGFVVLFSPFYIGAYFFAKERELAFQHLNQKFYSGFFRLLRFLIPGARWHIDAEIRSIHSAVIVCNHISYLDSILMISLFRRQKTIVKSRFFKIPIFRRIIDLSGFIPADAEESMFGLILARIEEMKDYLASGGNLFIFPEGTRSRNGRLGRFNQGAFKIARRCGAPIKVLQVRNTDRLFRPGRFLFNTGFSGDVTIRLLGTIDPAGKGGQLTVSELMRQARSLMEGRQEGP